MPYFVFEGIDGSGTTTQSKKLVDLFRERGHRSLWISEPTTGPIGVIIRDYFEGRLGELPNWRTMFHLFQADREQQYKEILSDLELGYFIVSDRNWLSSLVYQTASAKKEEGKHVVREASHFISACNEHAPRSDATFLLDVPVVEAMNRLNKDKNDYFEKQEFLEQVRLNYLSVRGSNPLIRRIDTSGKSIDEVFSLIDKQVTEAGFGYNGGG